MVPRISICFFSSCACAGIALPLEALASDVVASTIHRQQKQHFRVLFFVTQLRTGLLLLLLLCVCVRVCAPVGVTS